MSWILYNLKSWKTDNLLTPMSSKIFTSFFTRFDKFFSKWTNLFSCHLVHKRSEQVDSEKDSFILMNEFEQESHKRASQNRVRRQFELIKLKLFYFLFKWEIVSLDKTLIHRLESFKALWTVCSLYWKCLFDLEPFG